LITENEIRPAQLFDEYLRLSEEDGKRLDPAGFSRIACPGCGSENVKFCLKKYEFNFDQCTDCKTLFCNPRPTPDQLNAFYANSVSANFWSTKFLPAVQDARKEKLVKPKVKEMVDYLNSLGTRPKNICDIGASHGFLLEELREYYPQGHFWAIEPDAHSCKLLTSKGMHVHQGVLGGISEWKGKMDFVTCFEVLEHVHSPLEFVRHTRELLSPGGIALLTTLNSEGYDIVTLGEKSKSISPPHHLNFMTLEGFTRLFKDAGFSAVEVQTPGKLDVDIVLNSNVQNDFLEVLKRRGPATLQKFQNFLVDAKLSSHTWIWAKN
jgi:SAM-dependent methyltransferase